MTRLLPRALIACPYRGVDCLKPFWMSVLSPAAAAAFCTLAQRENLDSFAGFEGSRTYVSIDKGGAWNAFSEGNAMIQMDLTRLAFAENSFDFVMCSHVLENIRDDRKAIAEIHRVLVPSGLAALQFQLYGETTQRIENPTADDYYHVWHPGLDYFARYEEAGFTVQLYNGNRPDKEALGFYPRGVVPICVKLPR